MPDKRVIGSKNFSEFVAAASELSGLLNFRSLPPESKSSSEFYSKSTVKQSSNGTSRKTADVGI